MSCPDCGASVVAFAVPAEHRDAVSGAETATLCTRCLTLSPSADTDPPAEPSFDRLSSSFPTGSGAAETALLVGLLDALAPNRKTIEQLVVDAEAAGVDPFLTLGRLATDPNVSPAFDLDRRAQQLRQLL